MSIVPTRLSHLFTWLTFISLIIISGCEKSETEAPVIRPVLSMQVGGDASFGGRTFPGQARAIQEANLAFDVSGTLNQRPVKVGDRVKKGQLLASLDPRDYRSKFNAAKAELNRAKATFKRAEELIKEHHISEVEYDKLKATYEVAAANLETARKALSDTELKAPFDGEISELFVKNFVAVTAKQKIARLVDNTKIEMVIDIPETLISRAPAVKQVLVRFDAFPEHDIIATVKEIGTEASKTTRTYPVTLVMDQPEGITILPGMAGEARGDPDQIPQDLKEQMRRIEVPLSAVFSPDESNQSFVWVIDEQAGTVSQRAVKTGELKSQGLVIEDGLVAGEWIAVAGVHRLREGQKVRLSPVQGE